MFDADEEHTSFITDRGLYCYKVMPIGLKNARATYQCLVNKMFAEQLGKTMEVYIQCQSQVLAEEAKTWTHESGEIRSLGGKSRLAY